MDEQVNAWFYSVTGQVCGGGLHGYHGDDVHEMGDRVTRRTCVP